MDADRRGGRDSDRAGYRPSDSKFSTNCRDHRAARSPKAYFATRSGRHWSGHEHPKMSASEDRSEERARTGASGSRGMTTERSTTRRPRGLGAVEGAPHRRRPHRRTSSWRSPSATSPSVGFAENMAGHITWQPDGQTDMYVNPWGLWWQELTASDICVVDEDARVVRGRWDVTPAIHIHTELHRHAARRPGGDPQPPLLRQPDRCPRHAARTGSSDGLAVPRRHVSGREVRRRDRRALAGSRTGPADRFRQPGDPGEPRRHRHRPQPGRGGLPGGVDRARLPTGLRRDGRPAGPRRR